MMILIYDSVRFLLSCIATADDAKSSAVHCFSVLLGKVTRCLLCVGGSV